MLPDSANSVIEIVGPIVLVIVGFFIIIRDWSPSDGDIRGVGDDQERQKDPLRITVLRGIGIFCVFVGFVGFFRLIAQ